jgi:hypothetical protein
MIPIKKNQQNATMYQNFISYLYEAQHVSGDTPPIIRSLKLLQQPLVLHTWKVVDRVVAGRCQVGYERCTALLSHRSGRQPKTYVKPEAAITVFEFLMMSGASRETC